MLARIASQFDVPLADKAGGLPDTHRLARGCQTPTVWRGLPDTHRLVRGVLTAANRSECGYLEPRGGEPV
jgi:hypothetical protein